MDPLPRDGAPPAEAPPTLLEALARVPAAAALVVAALGKKDRAALRLAHTQLRDAVGEATTQLSANLVRADRLAAFLARPPTPRRWPRLEKLALTNLNLAALEALGSETWRRLSMLNLYPSPLERGALDEPCARALAAALRRMPALRALRLWEVTLSDSAAAEMSRKDSMPQLRVLAANHADLSPEGARALAATGWRLEALDLSFNGRLGAAGVAALVAAPAFAIRRLDLAYCRLDATAINSVANAPWPLEELNLRVNDFSSAAAGPALVALSRHAGLRRLDLRSCHLSAAGFKALVEATWPALTHLGASGAAVEFDGPHALGAAAFAAFPALEELNLSYVELGEAGARLLASRRWPRLRVLSLSGCSIGDAGLAALARCACPALWWLDLKGNGLSAPPTLEDARRWAPALVQLYS